MSGIGYERNKFHTCEKCPDRSVEPNCHATCRGYIYRQEQRAKINEQKTKDFVYAGFKVDRIAETKKKANRRKKR